MCVALSKTPKPHESSAPQNAPKPTYMYNPYLDGLGINAESRGRSSLRIDQSSPSGTAAPTGASSSGAGSSALAIQQPSTGAATQTPNLPIALPANPYNKVLAI